MRGGNRRDVAITGEYKRRMRPPASSPAASSTASRPAGWYQAWLEASGDVVVDPVHIRYWAEPPAQLDEELDRAKADGVTRFYCGFLPDEVDWIGFGGDWRQACLSARLQFRPFVLPAPPAVDPQARVLCLGDEAWGAAAATEHELARAWGVAAEVEASTLDATTLAPDELAREIAAASVIVNAVRDWSLGFAIDELAARLGRLVRRVGHPGYSPLRYALLGQPLVASTSDVVPHLRKLLGGRLAAMKIPATDAGAMSWFVGQSAAVRWSRLIAPRSFQDFWTPVNWTRMQPGPFDRPGSWLNRPASWAMLDAALATKEFPPTAAARAVETMTDWLLAEQRAENGGTVRGWALARWVMRHPEWIAAYRATGGDSRDGRAALVRWVRRGAEFPPAQARIFHVFRAAQWALKSEEAAATWPGSLIFAWAGSWDRVSAALGERTEVPPPLQAACAEACWTRLATARPESGDVAWLEQAAAWPVMLGGAAPVLRALTAARARRWASAVASWRDALVAAGIDPRQGGLARLLRVVFPQVDDALPVLSGWARGDAAIVRTFRFDLVAAWNQKRKWDLWRRPRARDVARELAIALELLRAFTRSGTGISATAWRLQALLAALARAPDEARTALTELAKLDPRAAEGAFSVATACWLMEQEGDARAITAAWPEQADERPILMFLRAVVAQLTGDAPVAARALVRLRAEAPAFFADRTIADARWAYLAAVFKDAGQPTEATRVRAIAIVATPGSEGMIDDVSDRGHVLAPGWLELLAP